ncbi:MAG: alpha/beta hydrolase [Roseburia sp.]|nr:alpha/beta hydrolase [Roseburia sp.]
MNHKGKTLFILASVTAATIHVINRVDDSHATMKDVLNSTENMYYEWRFGKIRYTKRGNGSPVLLIHDLNAGSSSYEFSKIIGGLSKKHEVYCIDLLGYGLSDKPNITFTNYLYVQMITDFIKTIIGRKTDIAATGNAFPLAVMTCHNDKELVQNLVGINPQNLYQLNQIPSKQTRALSLLMEIPILGTFLYHLHTNKSSLTRSFEEEYFYNPYKVEEKDILAYLEASHTAKHHAKHAQASLLGRYTNTNIIHALKEINNNIYIIAGKNENDIKNIIENYSYYNSAIEVSYIPRTKHLPQLENPEEVINCLDMYLTDIH